MKTAIERSLIERIGHALAFESLAIAIIVPGMLLFLDKPVFHLGVLALMFSTIAMLWNMLFNYLFDRAQARMGFERGLLVRIAHALLFEAGLILAVVPLAAWWLSVGLWEALLLDIGLILFFLPYTIGFNWLYDLVRERIMTRRQALPVTLG
ncbi:multidrug/biocide efflux PACE transporter [Pseudomonas sp. NCCP-436]|uniref:multidrug/biocide efflux PACE transporter n=1 Tax=Pseudomonas sp. NCCP-436 TaxID=2842481 RepID=UPI001C8015D4|nr:multidrug/biocide efflux PACE transporter [Pseudomonas sp. NCCP-436]GIZ13649.1 hypothetical protein NCCP436_30650 [Pseudomonas sp. NCCP-436]